MPIAFEIKEIKNVPGKLFLSAKLITVVNVDHKLSWE